MLWLAPVCNCVASDPLDGVAAIQFNADADDTDGEELRAQARVSKGAGATKRRETPAMMRQRYNDAKDFLQRKSARNSTNKVCRFDHGQCFLQSIGGLPTLDRGVSLYR